MANSSTSSTASSDSVDSVSRSDATSTARGPRPRGCVTVKARERSSREEGSDLQQRVLGGGGAGAGQGCPEVDTAYGCEAWCRDFTADPPPSARPGPPPHLLSDQSSHSASCCRMYSAAPSPKGARMPRARHAWRSSSSVRLSRPSDWMSLSSFCSGGGGARWGGRRGGGRLIRWCEEGRSRCSRHAWEGAGSQYLGLHPTPTP